MDEYKFLKAKFNCLVFSIVILVSIPVHLISAKHPYDHFTAFCKIGERVPGTAGHLVARDFIISSMRNPEVDSFSVFGTNYYNIYKRFPGEEPRIGFAAHWDSDIGCPGANDGGSGVSLLLSLADTLEKNPTMHAVDLLFFDGEDVGGAELLGSRHFAANCLTDYNYIIVLDMVGDKDLQIFQEGNSAKFFPAFVDSIWEIGREIAPEVFVPIVKYYITDDHISLIKYGIRSIDIIDFDYPYWDTADDTADRCSRQSLDTMFRFILSLVYQRPRL
ncbi:MAG: M28 family peptidase [candidate division WOR-3 bacterium]|nr:MAG: M28 family peptidase [candidate division WOR-3 bacterium]